MACAIAIKACGASAAPIRDLWARLGALEPAPSMLALGYPPHVTLAVYDNLAEERLREALRAVFADRGPLRLRFGRLAAFESPRLVYWAAPDRSAPLEDAHAAVHRLIPPSLSHPHYRPDQWVPHCTLATEVAAEGRAAAGALAAQPFEAFEVEFGHADALAFPPVRVIEEVRLCDAG